MARCGRILSLLRESLQRSCRHVVNRGLLQSRCKLWEKGEPNRLKLLGVQTFSVASSMTLYSAAPPDRILTRSPYVTACRGRNLAPRLKKTRFKYNPTLGTTSPPRAATSRTMPYFSIFRSTNLPASAGSYSVASRSNDAFEAGRFAPRVNQTLQWYTLPLLLIAFS